MRFGEILVIDLPDFKLSGIEPYFIVSDVENHDWEKMLKNSKPVSEGGCFVRDILSANNPNLQMYRQHHCARLRTYPVSAWIHYYDLNRFDLRKQEFPAIGP